MPRSSPYLQAAIDPPDDACTRCDGDGWVVDPYKPWLKVPCECRNGDDWPDAEDLRADAGCRAYHQRVDERGRA